MDADYRIIGTAVENKRLAHVVVEAQRALTGVDLSGMEIFIVRQGNREWWIVTSTPRIQNVA